MKPSTELEMLVAKIQAQLAPDATIEHNARLEGLQSKRSRQIDVLVRQKIGQYEMKIVLECKDYNRPVDVKGIEEFHGLLADVAAHKGAIVSAKGFTEAAKRRAESLQLDLYSPVDTDPHKWTAKVTAPVICDFVGASMAFGMSSVAPGPFRLPYEFHKELNVIGDSGQELGTCLLAAKKRWNAGLFPTAIGTHERLEIFPGQRVTVDNGFGDQMPINLFVTLRVEKETYIGNLPISRISGFKDELSGAIITNAFETGMFNPDEVVNTWQRVNPGEKIEKQFLFRATGLIGWDEGDQEER